MQNTDDGDVSATVTKTLLCRDHHWYATSLLIVGDKFSAVTKQNIEQKIPRHALSWGCESVVQYGKQQKSNQHSISNPTHLD